MHLILTPFHFRPFSAGTWRTRLETEAAARQSPRPSPHVSSRAPSQPASPPHAPRRPRAQPPSRNIDCTVRRMGRGGSWTRINYAQLAVAMLTATEDPIVGVDQRSTEYQVKLYRTFATSTLPLARPSTARRQRPLCFQRRRRCRQRSLLFLLLSPSSTPSSHRRMHTGPNAEPDDCAPPRPDAGG
jgi:hypothetical protein